MSNLS
jgi:hypothetical protein